MGGSIVAWEDAWVAMRSGPCPRNIHHGRKHLEEALGGTMGGSLVQLSLTLTSSSSSSLSTKAKLESSSASNSRKSKRIQNWLLNQQENDDENGKSTKSKVMKGEKRPGKIQECSLCKKQLGSSQSLHRHHRAQHSNLGLFPCRILDCDKKFKYEATRGSHEKTHKKQKTGKSGVSQNDQNQRELRKANFEFFPCKFENCTFKTDDRRILAHHLCEKHSGKLLRSSSNQN